MDTGGARVDEARTENPHRNLMQQGAMHIALAPGPNNAAVTQKPIAA